MLVYQILCLCFTLFVLQQYVNLDVYSKTHRLLPLVLGLIGVYNFYQVLQCIVPGHMLFSGLENLLLIQMIYLIMYYVVDFYRIRLSILIKNFLFAIWLLVNVTVVLLFQYPDLYQKLYQVSCILYILVTFGVTAYAYIKKNFTKREYFVYTTLYFALYMAAFGVLLRDNQVIPGSVVTSGALALSCLIIYYLCYTDRIVDTESLIQENIYDVGYIPTILFDPDYYYLGANSAAKNLFPNLLHKARPGRKAGEYQEKVKAVIRNPAQELMVEDRYYQFQVSPAFHRNQLKGYAIFILDVTDRKQETKEMKLLKEKAEIQTILKGQFLARMSHDLRSPLHAIIGISDILAGKWDISKKDRSLIMHIKNAGNTLLELVNSILVYSKLEAGKLELNRNHYNIEQLLEELAHMCVINLKDKPVDFVMCNEDEYPLELIGDDLRVREIVQNLLSNAVKFTQTGRIECRLSCKYYGIKRVGLTCTVEDTGPGMDEEQLKRVFEEYTSYTDERTLEGTGLGLCIVKQLANLMGGSANAYSDGKNGFKVTVDFFQEVGSDVKRPPVTFDKEYLFRQKVSWTRSCTPNWVYPEARILLADDMKVNQEIFRELTAFWEFKVDTVFNGREAMEAVENREYQMIFLDQMMPEMTGIEAAARIREKYDMPIIILTAMLSDDMRAECKRYGLTDVLSKPVDLSRLQIMIEKYMPDSYRKRPGLVTGEQARIQGNNPVIQRRIMQTFLDEVRSLMDKLPEYAEQDLKLFQTKVHGIKGIGRQMGKGQISDFAEILEMAAKTNNTAFIRSHLDDFLIRLENLLSDMEEELQYLPEPEQKETGTCSSEELFRQLKEGFDNYDLGRIEESLEHLKAVCLTEKENLLFEQVCMAYQELEYEKGSQLLAEWK